MAQAAIIAAPAAPASSREETRTGALRQAARIARRLFERPAPPVSLTSLEDAPIAS